jgi:spermidine/putrescine-binding protein
MKKIKRILSAAVALALCAGLSACGGAAPAGADPGELNIYFWTEYMPDSVIADFEAETGIKVNMVNYSNNEDMLNRVRTDTPGTYDICAPSDYMVEYMIGQDLLDPIDMSKITNFGNIGEGYKNPSFDPGNKYSIPYMGGTVTMAINKSVVTDPITSYNDIFVPKYAGQLCVLDDFRAIIGVTALSMGYSMSETDEAVLSEISTRLMDLKPLVKTYDSDNPKELLITGGVPIAICWSAEIALAMEENPDIEVVYPEEGTYLFIDNFVIPKGAKNSENAHLFIDYILRPDVSAKISEEFPYVNPNTEAVKLLPDSYKNNAASNPPQEVFAKGEYISDVGDKISIYDKMWTDLKG